MTGRVAGIVGFVALAIVLQATVDVPIVASHAAASASEEHEKKPRLSQRRFYTMEPFTVPIMVDGEIGQQFTLVIALELADEDDRSDVAHAVPLIRNQVYSELLNLVTFRRRGSPVPEIAVFKQQLLKVARRFVGDKVTGLLVQQAFKSPLH